MDAAQALTVMQPANQPGEGGSTWSAADAADAARWSDAARKAQAKALRKIYGNPFRAKRGVKVAH